MTGLEKILAEISGEAQAARQAALDEARQQAEAILQESARRTEAECEKLRAQGKKSCEDMISQARAGAELQRRRVLLETRQRLIGETLRAAGNAILIRIASLYAHPGEGVAHLSRRDLDRLPPDFEKQLNQALPEGCRLTISAEPRSMYGGMVLVYGGVEENCSLRALFGSRSENLLNLADEVMFGPRT